jgi:hypothetical protein
MFAIIASRHSLAAAMMWAAHFIVIGRNIAHGRARRAKMRWTVIVAAMLGVMPTSAQEAGWHYSPLPGEGDRAALGCASGSSTQDYACVAVRCEDDFSVGLHLYTSRIEGDAGAWTIDIDEEQRDFIVSAEDSPYGARIAGDTDWLRGALEQGAVAYLQPLTGAPLQLSAVPLSGSLSASTQALAYCAPRVPKAAAEPNEGAGVDLRTSKEN